MSLERVKNDSPPQGSKGGARRAPAAAQEFRRNFIMKDGRSAVIRPLRMGDAAQWHALDRAIVAAGIGTVRALAECDKAPDELLADTRQWVDGPRSGHRGCLLIAEVQGQLVGGASIRRMAQTRIRHVGHIGIGVHPQFQGLGLGRALMLGLIEWAASGQGRGVTRLELFVFADNLRATALYKSLGFVEEGRRRRVVRYEDGRETDDLMMALLLDRHV